MSVYAKPSSTIHLPWFSPAGVLPHLVRAAKIHHSGGLRAGNVITSKVRKHCIGGWCKLWDIIGFAHFVRNFCNVNRSASSTDVVYFGCYRSRMISTEQHTTDKASGVIITNNTCLGHGYIPVEIAPPKRGNVNLDQVGPVFIVAVKHCCIVALYVTIIVMNL